jgi:hypothetical protein
VFLGVLQSNLIDCSGLVLDNWPSNNKIPLGQVE